MAMSMKEINEKLTDKFVKFLEDGLVNEQWVKPWNFANALPKRYDPKEKTWVTYSGTNFYFLALESLCMGYEFEEWGTFKQWKALGRVVRKGECGTEAFLPITVKKKDENGEEESVFVGFRVYRVFNYAQTEKVEDNGYETSPKEKVAGFEGIKEVDEFFSAVAKNANWGMIDNPGDRAYYSPVNHTVYVPPKDQFTDARYYSTLAHESIHATGHESLMNRPFGRQMSSPKYAIEELVAELGGSFICANLGIGAELDSQHMAYISSWIKALKADAAILRKIMRIADHAAKGIFALSKGEDFEWKPEENTNI